MVVYKSPPATFEELTDPLPGDVQEIANLLRKCIRLVLPEADEQVSGGERIGMALYSLTHPGVVICGIQPTASMCKLYFHRWEELKMRGYKLEGSGKNARHIKLRNPDDYQSDKITDMLTIVKNEMII